MAHEWLVRLVRPMNTTDRILGEMLDASGLITGPAAQYLSVDQVNELSYTDMLMSMVPSPDSFDFGPRTTNQLRNGAYIFGKGLLDKLARDPNWFQQDRFTPVARSINGVRSEFLILTNNLSWMIAGDAERRRKNALALLSCRMITGPKIGTSLKCGGYLGLSSKSWPNSWTPWVQ